MSLVTIRTCDNRRAARAALAAAARPQRRLPARMSRLPGALCAGRRLGRNLDLDENAFAVAEPETIALEPRRRVEQRDAIAFDARPERGKILGIAAEREMMQRASAGPR